MEERYGFCSSCKYVLVKLKDEPCNKCKIEGLKITEWKAKEDLK